MDDKKAGPFQAQTTATPTTSGFIPWQPVAPSCPTCGRCPTCGHGGGYLSPYPYPAPWRRWPAPYFVSGTTTT